METTLPSTLQALLLNFAPVFTAPSFENFVRLVTGWMLCRGRHTVSAAIRAGGTGQKHFSALYRFFSRAQWDPDELGRILFDLLLDLVPGDIHLLVDDTLSRRSGPHFWGAGMHHDPLQSTYGRGSSGRHLALAFGHNRVTLALWVPLPWDRTRGRAVPFLWRTYRSKKRCPEPQYRTRPQLAVELLKVFMSWNPSGRKLTLVGDSEYACNTVVRGLAPNVHFIGPMVMDAALYDRPHSQPPRGKRLKGARLLSPEKLAASKRHWQTVCATIYGRKVTLKVKTQVGMWYSVAHTRLVRVVITRDPTGHYKDRAYFATDLKLSIEEILTGFSRRWSLEVAFRDAKQCLGLEDPQNGWWRKAKRQRRRHKRPGPQPRGNLGRAAVEHTWPLAFCAYGLTIAWYFRHGQPQRDVQRARLLSPWYRHKKEPSFADMLDAIGRESWQARITAYPPLRRVRSLILGLLSPAPRIPA